MALPELVIEGIQTNQALHLKILDDEGFQNIDYYKKGQLDALFLF